MKTKDETSDTKEGCVNEALECDSDCEQSKPSQIYLNLDNKKCLLIEGHIVPINDTVKLEVKKIVCDENANIQTATIREDNNFKQCWLIFRGLLYSLTSSIFFSVTTVIVKYLSEIHPGQMACFRFAGILLFSVPVVMSCGENVFGPSDLRVFVLLRGIAGASSLYLRYNALHYIPIANATVIVLSMPIFVCIFARIFLKEAFGLFHVIALTVTLVGIGFTSKLGIIFGSNEKSALQGFDRQNEIYGLLSSMGATIVGATAYIFVRKVKGLHHSVILFNFAWVAIIETSIITYALDGFKLPKCGIAPWLLMLLAIFSFYGQFLLTRALQLEEAGLVSVVRAAAEVFFAFLFQILLFKQIPDMYSFIGAFLVTSAVLLTSVRKWVTTLADNHWARNVFAFTLK
ncbi:transmembrane protein-like protein [Leptotrombidium deliense]|uniref:Transmembrane protein-like protein n=1 Tax=Leptotrombidium deliense TaxID=299467 RepID=A0A443SK34_9ACAR|nr:transmembrane protein-like protein [Leptotrombidium deliense]